MILLALISNRSRKFREVSSVRRLSPDRGELALPAYAGHELNPAK